jgi:hypothetical protein
MEAAVAAARDWDSDGVRNDMCGKVGERLVTGTRYSSPTTPAC